MSNQKAVNEQNAVTTATDVPGISPDAMVEQLRALRAQIPEYVQLKVSDARAIRTVASLNPEFAQAAINGVGASPRVEATVGQNAEQLQQMADTAARWTAVEDELKAMLKGVSSANLTRRHRLGQAVLLTYAVSKKLVLVPEHADLIPHLENMRRLNRMGRRKAQVQPPAAPATAPAATPKV